MEEKKEFKPNCANCMAKAKIEQENTVRFHFECRRNPATAMLQPARVVGQGGFTATHQVVSAWPVINPNDVNAYCLQWVPDRETQMQQAKEKAQAFNEAAIAKG